MALTLPRPLLPSVGYGDDLWGRLGPTFARGQHLGVRNSQISPLITKFPSHIFSFPRPVSLPALLSDSPEAQPATSCCLAIPPLSFCIPALLFRRDRDLYYPTRRVLVDRSLVQPSMDANHLAWLFLAVVAI